MAIRRTQPRVADEQPRALTPTAGDQDSRPSAATREKAPDRAERSEELRRRVDDIYERFESDFQYLAER